MKILIVEDEIGLANSIARYLSTEHYVCEIAHTAHDAEEKIVGYDYDCILLDITLGDGNGLQLLEDLKMARKTEGVIIISARDSLDDRVTGLKLGADDYLTKPFHLAELSARVAAVIRRKRFDGSNRIDIQEISIDLSAMKVLVNGREVDLTRKEFDLLLFLASNRNRVVSKSAIAEHLSGDIAEVFDNFDFIYAHMKNLKKKLGEAGSKDYIKTVYGLGYRLEG
jgi:DNA-binding response OmpR family regulator